MVMECNNFLRALSNINYRALVALVALDEEQSMCSSAEKLGISQSAMSKLLIELKLEFNDSLYIKNHNHFQLTPKGNMLCNIIRKTIYSAQPMLEQLKSGVKNSYNICVPHWFNIQRISDEISNLRSSYPFISINFTPSCSNEAENIITNLKSGIIDIALRHYPHTPPYGVHSKLVGFSEFMVLQQVCPDTSLNYRSAKEALLNSPIIVYNVSSNLLATFMQNNNFDECKLNIRYVLTNNFVHWLNNLANGGGVIITLKNTGEDLIKSGNYRPLIISDDMIVRFPHHLIWHESSSSDPIMRLIRKIFINHAK